MTFHSLPLAPRPALTATEARLERIYAAAKRGLKNEALALAAGLLPQEYRSLREFDPLVEMAEAKGRADAEMELSGHLYDAAQAGDTKAALAILQHQHGWVAKQQISVDVEQRISIVAALAQATTRVIEGSVLDTVEAADALTPDGPLTNRDRNGGYDTAYAGQSANATKI